jgi:hypothetical protein
MAPQPIRLNGSTKISVPVVLKEARNSGVSRFWCLEQSTVRNCFKDDHPVSLETHWQKSSFRFFGNGAEETPPY